MVITAATYFYGKWQLAFSPNRTHPGPFHQANGGSFTRTFALAIGSSRLASVTIGQAVYSYAYDANGNMVREGTAQPIPLDPAPLIAAWLFGKYHTPYAIAWYIAACAVISVVATALMTDWTGKDIHEEY